MHQPVYIDIHTRTAMHANEVAANNATERTDTLVYVPFTIRRRRWVDAGRRSSSLRPAVGWIERGT